MNITREQFKKLAKKHLIALQGYDMNETIEIYGVEKLYDEIVESENTDISTEEVTRVNVIDDVSNRRELLIKFCDALFEQTGIQITNVQIDFLMRKFKL